MVYSVGKAIREIKPNSEKLYLLSGDDYFLQKFFISKLNEINNNKYQLRYLNLDEEEDLNILIHEISFGSLFSNNNLFILRNSTKLSIKNKDEIILYLNNPKDSLIIIFISEDYYTKNKFFKTISTISKHIDTRTPFPNKIKEWIKYYITKNKIEIDTNLLDEIIFSNNDEIYSIINEIEKLYLISDCNKIEYNANNLIIKNNRNIRPWQLLDSLGKKNIELSIKNMEDLLAIGYSVIPLIINQYNFYIYLLELFNSDTQHITVYGLNKIIISNMIKYSKEYTESELMNILIDLKNMDILVKTTNLNHKNLLSIFIIKICQGYYE